LRGVCAVEGKEYAQCNLTACRRHNQPHSNNARAENNIPDALQDENAAEEGSHCPTVPNERSEHRDLSAEQMEDPSHKCLRRITKTLSDAPPMTSVCNRDVTGAFAAAKVRRRCVDGEGAHKLSTRVSATA